MEGAEGGPGQAPSGPLASHARAVHPHPRRNTGITSGHGTAVAPGQGTPRSSPRNSSSVRRFLWVSRKERSPSRPAGDPRETMSKRMGLLKTLRTGGGSGAGPFAASGCFLREKRQRWKPEPLPRFPTCAMSLRVLSHWGQARGDTSRLGSPVRPGQPPHAQQPSAPSASPAPTQVLLQRVGPPAVPLGLGHAPAPRVKPDRSEQSAAGGRTGDNRSAPGTGNGGRTDGGCPSRGLPVRGLMGHPGPLYPPPRGNIPLS